jgi:CheY-like chemotaxis protein/HPt (histidine-containing phosphotransfer) domain-containing protein
MLLQILAPGPQAWAETSPAGEPALGPSLRVLLVEDNPVNQQVALGFLRRAGHRPQVATDGNEAVEAALTGAYDVVLMDVQMPVMDGFEATALIRAHEQIHGGHLPIYGLTARAQAEDRDRCLAAGMDGFLPKPINRAQLLQALASLAPSAPSPDAQQPPVSPAALDEGDPLDPGAVAKLRELDAGGFLSLREFVQVVLGDGEQRLESLRQALAQGDAKGLEREAHTLKGSSRELGARNLGALCQQLEDLGAAGAVAQAALLLGDLERHYGRVKKALENLV